MVKLTLVEGSAAYFQYQGFLFGPCGVKNAQRSEKTIEWRHPSDTIFDFPSLYGQNDCNHWKVEADLVSDRSPSLTTVPAPIAGEPYRISISCKLNGLGLSYPAVRRGKFSGEDRFVHEDLTTTHSFYAVSQGDSGQITVAVLLMTHNTRPTSRIHSFTRYSFELPEMEVGKPFILKGTRHNYPGRYAPASFPAMYDDVTIDDIKSYPEIYGGTSTSSQFSTQDNWYEPLGSTSVPIDEELAKSIINARLGFLPEYFIYPEELSHYGDLANSAVGGLDAVQMNMISFLRELPEISSLIPKLQNLKKLRNIRNAIKDTSDVYLTGKYGWMPTISDLQEIWHAMTKYTAITDRNGFRTTSARSISSINTSHDEKIEATQCIKLAIATEDSLFLSLLEGLEFIGLFPSLNNLWDLVPYSFVLDWFIDLGDLLERVDTRLRLLRLDIKYVTMSLKVVRSKHLVIDDVLPLIGDAHWVHYRRWTTNHCPVPPLSLQTTALPTNHWLEGSALLVQRMR